ncbi:MAG: 2-oxoglutarate dehydrogenase, E2 component, dihydrolipoamide succinyltransferase [Ignavibacteriaceae bacterium]
MDVIMPKMGESVSEGTIIKWHKKKGDKVKRDEIIFEISTDKVDTEIPSPADGILSEIKANEGDTVEVGSVVAVIESNGEVKSEKPEEISETKDEKLKIEEKEKVEPKEEKIEEKRIEKVSESKKNAEDKKAEPEATDDITEVTMPKMGESVMEGTVIKWYKKTGEKIKKDETFFEISTDKVDTEIPSPVNGVVSEILVGEQETVEVGTIVAKIFSGEGKPEGKVQKAVEPEKSDIKEKKEPASMHENFSEAKASSLEEKDKEKKGSSRFYSPLVMNIAQKENISHNELEKIEGSGLEGRVTKKDILAYIENRSPGKIKTEAEEKKVVNAESEKSFADVATSQLQPGYSSNEVQKIEMDNIRQKIMQHMIRSRDTSVHVSAMLEVDMTRIYNFLKKHKEEYIKKEDVKLTYMAFIAHASVKALREFPLVNSSIEGSTIVKKKFINLGIAVAIEPTGLIVPNIKGAGEKNIIGLAKAINDVANRARNKKISPDEISDGTFTITNYGIFGTIFGTPIINQPEVAILGVGVVEKKPVVVEVDGTDSIAIKPVMALTLSHDHRLVDGMLGGRFLKYIKDVLENFDGNVG